MDRVGEFGSRTHPSGRKALINREKNVSSTEASIEPPQPTPQGDGAPGPFPDSPTDLPTAGNGSMATKAGFKPPSIVRVGWAGEHRFDVSDGDGKPESRIDASGVTGPGPVRMLLGALASCVSVDVVDILAKSRTQIDSLSVDVVGERPDAVPAPIVSAELTFHISGPDVQRARAERAIDLAVTKYCSVRDSLNPSTPVTWKLKLNGEA